MALSEKSRPMKDANCFGAPAIGFASRLRDTIFATAPKRLKLPPQMNRRKYPTNKKELNQLSVNLLPVLDKPTMANIMEVIQT
mmetsp:Transcript_2286/g.5221  ORF Transcript_2286/g.5221 Transcript_2286/m.5221 type:complete len:83 (-) Transcript_2286:294-542(-)